MSEILEKTIAVIPKLIAGKLLSNNSTGTGTFQQFVKTLGKITSQYEEDKFIKGNISMQKDRLASPNCPLGEKREILVTLLYCDMLGYDVTYAHIHALKLAHQGTLREKRTGYLACTMFLQENDELVILLTGSLMKDLNSSNVLHICYALDAAACLISAELMPTMLPKIQERLRHPKELVRRKAVMCVHSFLRRAPSMVQHLLPAVHHALTDPQPSVMAAALHCYTILAQTDASVYRGSLVPALLGLVEQVLSRQLPPEYEHHGVPAPWLTVHVLKLLATLARDDQQCSELVYPVLSDVLQRTEITHKAGLAVIYECVETIAALPAHPALLEHATACVARFLTAKSVNYKYLGVKVLTSIVKVNPQYAAAHQDVIMECLDHHDVDIRQKTLELLYHMANSVNVSVISARLLDSLDSLATSTQPQAQAKAEIVNKVLTLTQKFAKRHENYLETVSRVLRLAGDATALDGWTDTILHTIQHGTEALPACEDSHLLAVRTFWNFLQQDTLPPPILSIAVWVLGEYSHLTTLPDLPEICRCLLEWYSRAGDTSARLAILAAFTKLLLTAGDTTAAHVLSRLEEEEEEKEEDCMQIKQRLEELQKLCQSSTPHKETFRGLLLGSRLPDFTLSFLDDYVAASLENGGGGEPYRRTAEKCSVEEASSVFAGIQQSSLYPRTLLGASSSSMATDSGPASSLGSSASSTAAAKELMSSSLQVDGVKRVWGRGGGNLRRKKALSPVSSELVDSEDSEESRAIDDEQTHKSQLTASLFAGISPTYDTSYQNIQPSVGARHSTENPVLHAVEPGKPGKSAALNSGMQNLNLQSGWNRDVLVAGRTDRVWSQSARDLDVQKDHFAGVDAISISYQVDDLPPMECSVDPQMQTQLNQFQPDSASSKPVGEMSKPSEPVCETTTKPVLDNASAADTDNGNVLSASAAAADARNYTFARANAEPRLNLSKAASQSLLSASALTSPEECSAGSMYTGLAASDFSSPCVNVAAIDRTTKDQVGKLAKLDWSPVSSPCKSAGSMDTDSIEEEEAEEEEEEEEEEDEEEEEEEEEE